jgi:hypothetical protein
VPLKQTPFQLSLACRYYSVKRMFFNHLFTSLRISRVHQSHHTPLNCGSDCTDRWRVRHFFLTSLHHNCHSRPWINDTSIPRHFESNLTIILTTEVQLEPKLPPPIEPAHDEPEKIQLDFGPKITIIVDLSLFGKKTEEPNHQSHASHPITLALRRVIN